VRIRMRKPWVFLRFRLFGWKVFFMGSSDPRPAEGRGGPQVYRPALLANERPTDGSRTRGAPRAARKVAGKRSPRTLSRTGAAERPAL
jgi:hypothetical protein